MRQKIELDKTKMTKIPAKDIAETNKRIRERMEPVIREFRRKQAITHKNIK